MSLPRLIPPSASTIASEVDWITLGLLLLSGFIVIVITGLILFFIVHYRAKPGQTIMKTRTFLVMELAWAGIPLIISLVLFTWASVVYFKMRAPPAGAAEIYVVAKQWMWKFQHSDGRQEVNELHVPVGTPIRLLMISQDVIHSLFIPAFRIKQDILPGRYTETWFEATLPGEYHLFCTEYCGTSHSKMTATVFVMEPAQFAAWQASGIGQQTPGASSLASRGQALFTRLGCVSCHGKGSAVRAPDLTGIYGQRVGLRTGQSVVVDESYIRESILRPSAKITQGYDPIMPSFESQVSEEDLSGLIAYIKSLTHGPGMKP